MATLNGIYTTAYTSITDLRTYTTAWQTIKGLWQSNWYESPPGTWNHEWLFLGSWSAPSENMTNVTIGITQQVTPPQAQVAWTTYNSPDIRSTYSVYILWNVNGSDLYSDVVAQSTGQVTRDFVSGDAVYAKIRYTNSKGNGPLTTTSTLYL
jgi:hypothetical protein